VENVYRLDKTLFDRSGAMNPDAFQLAQFFNRISAFGRIKNDLKLREITGVRIYKELCRIAGVDIDSMTSYGKRIAISDSLYSVALGTLELSIYEQMHLFNMLYNNELIEQPASHPSLMIDSVILNNNSITISDTIRKFHPFGDINNIRPTLLGLYKRLTGNPGDGLHEFDIPYSVDSSVMKSGDSAFSSEFFTISRPLSNFAKSGTSDDVIRPFNEDVTSKKRTNYGIWNAVLRLDLSLISKDSTRDTADVTLACIGECNTRFTGVRDGKTLHKFVSMGLLRKAGIKCGKGFFSQYEEYLKKVTPEAIKNCGVSVDSAAIQNELREAGD
jgi:hypothetical protein